MSGQSIVDRLNAAKHTVAGSQLGRAVVKATTEEIMPPKRKHLDCKLNLNVACNNKKFKKEIFKNFFYRFTSFNN